MLSFPLQRRDEKLNSSSSLPTEFNKFIFSWYFSQVSQSLSLSLTSDSRVNIAKRLTSEIPLIFHRNQFLTVDGGGGRRRSDSFIATHLPKALDVGSLHFKEIPSHEIKTLRKWREAHKETKTIYCISLLFFFSLFVLRSEKFISNHLSSIMECKLKLNNQNEPIELLWVKEFSTVKQLTFLIS